MALVVTVFYYNFEIFSIADIYCDYLCLELCGSPSSCGIKLDEH